MHQTFVASDLEEDTFASDSEIVRELSGDQVLLPVELDKWTPEIERQARLCTLVFISRLDSALSKIS